MQLLLLSLGCITYYATGGGELELTLSDEQGSETLLVPGQLGDLSGHGTPYGADIPNCTEDGVSWLMQERYFPRSLQACAEPVDLVVWIDAGLPFGEALSGEEAGIELRLVLPDGDVAVSQDELGLTVFLEDRETGWIQQEGVPVWDGRGQGTRYGEPYRALDLELAWSFEGWTRTPLRREFDPPL
ncbi:MAG: hypothetical protein H6741_10130 [Alphaproteobacteria bacterium]|nr:hypothetical protein [Alphaproteobacteria bacterium]